MFESSSQNYGAISRSFHDKEQAETPPAKDAANEETSQKLEKRENLFRLFNLGLMAIVIMGFGMCVSLFAPFFPTEAERRGVSATTVGLIFSSFTLVMFLGSIASGVLVRALGLHFMIWAGTLLAGGSTVLFGLLDMSPPGDAYVVLCFFARLIEGIGASLYNNAAFSIVGQLYPKHISTNYAILRAAAGVGRMIGPSLGGVLFSVGGFPLPFYVVGGILLVAGFLSQAVLRCTMPPENSSKKEENEVTKPTPKRLPWTHLFRISFDIWIVAVTLVGGSFLLSLPMPIVSLYFEQLGLTNSIEIGLVFLASSLVYIISAVVSGKLADMFRLFLYKMMILACILNAIAFAICGPVPMLTAILSPSVGLTIGGFIFASVGMAVLTTPAPQAIMAAAHESGYQDGLDTSAMVSGIFNGMWFLGAFLGAPFGGLLMDLVGFQWGAFIMAVFSLIIAIPLVVREVLHKLGVARTRRPSCAPILQTESVV